MKLNIDDTKWLMDGDTHTTVTEADLAERLNFHNIVGPVRDGEDIILTFSDNTSRILRFEGEDVTDGETLAWNFSDETGDYYLKVVKD